MEIFHLNLQKCDKKPEIGIRKKAKIVDHQSVLQDR